MWCPEICRMLSLSCFGFENCNLWFESWLETRLNYIPWMKIYSASWNGRWSVAAAFYPSCTSSHLGRARKKLLLTHFTSQADSRRKTGDTISGNFLWPRSKKAPETRSYEIVGSIFILEDRLGCFREEGGGGGWEGWMRRALFFFPAKSAVGLSMACRGPA